MANRIKKPVQSWLDRFGDGHEEYLFRCPAQGCGDHRVIVKRGSRARPEMSEWSFNESLDRPTFQPSLLVREYHGDEVVRVCHSFITDGRIQFLGDCTHELAGQTVDLVEVPEC